MGHLESVPLPDADTLTSLLGSGFDHLGHKQATELTALLGGVAATAGGGAGVVLPFVVQSLASEKVVEYGQDLDTRLTDYAAGLDEDDRKEAALATVAGGVSRLLPDGEELQEASLAAGRGNPGALIEVLERYQDDKARAELEQAVEDVLAGQIGGGRQAFVDRLQDEFGTDTPEEAVALFREFRDLLEEETVQETLGAVLDVQVEVEAIGDELAATRAELNDSLEALFQVELGGEGFRRLTPTYLDKEPAELAVAFRAGFELVEVAEGYAMERRRRDAEETVEEELLEQLRDDGEDVVVLGPPGSGKSTVCMQVAVEWYVHQHGTVLYRKDGPPAFENPEVLRQTIRQGDGHVLVVVEDAMREPAREVLDVMEEYDHRSDVSFLLDSRRREWTEEGGGMLDSRNSVHVNRDVAERHGPALHPDECERLVKHFRDVTGSTASPDPERLLERVRSDKVQDEWPSDAAPGEIYLVLQSLSQYADPLGDHGDAKTPTPLMEDVQEVYDDLAERGETALDVGVTANLLNAGGFGLYRELFYALASDATAGRAEDAPDHGFAEIEEALTELIGRVVFEQRASASGEESAPPFRGIHEAWSVAFLNHALDAERRKVARKRFGRCVTRLLSLADDGDLRDRIDDALEGGVGYLNRIELDITEWADDLVGDLLSFGEQYPGLAPLFGTHNYDRISLPEVGSEEQQLQLVNRRGVMYIKRGDFTKAEGEFEALTDITTGVLEDEGSETHWRAMSLEQLGIVARNRGDLDAAEDYHQQSLKLKRQVDDVRGTATSFNNLGAVAQERGDLNAAEDYHRQSLELKREIGEAHETAKSLGNLGLVARKQGDFDAAEDYHQKSLEIERRVGNRYGEARSLSNLGLVAQERGELDTAEGYHRQSLELLREISDRYRSAKTLNNLGLIAWKRGNLDIAEGYHQRSLETFREIGDAKEAAVSLHCLGQVMVGRDEYRNAKERFENAACVFYKHGTIPLTLASLWNLVECCEFLGNLASAMKYCEQGAELARDHDLQDKQMQFEKRLLGLLSNPP